MNSAQEILKEESGNEVTKALTEANCNECNDSQIWPPLLTV
jgi:hypothetical protein